MTHPSGLRPPSHGAGPDGGAFDVPPILEMARLSMRAFLRAVTLKAHADGKPIVRVLESLVSAQFTSHVVNGHTVIRTSGNGAEVEFTVPDGLTPTAIMEIASEALDWVEQQPDPTAPGLPVKVRRLRVAFNRATI